MTDVDAARDFLRDHPRAVLATYRRDGQVQQSPVVCAVDAEGRVVVSSTEDRAKVRNLRRDPRISVCAFTDGFFGPWVQVEGEVEIVDGAAGVEVLVDYYRRLSGEHPDWADYRAGMVRDRRVALRFTIARASGQPTR